MHTSQMRFTTLGLFALGLALSLPDAAWAREGFKIQRFDENWSQFQSSTGAEADVFDPVKNVRLGESGALSFGGSVRLRLENWSNFGFAGANDDFFLLGQVMLHSELRLGHRMRLFMEGRSASATNRNLPGGRRAVLDVDEFALWNTFVEGQFEAGSGNLTLRGGRQELAFGKERLISALQWANNRRIFDGARFTYRSGDMRLDGFAVMPVTLRKYEVNEPDTDRIFSGLYFNNQVSQNFGIDAYLLSLNTRQTAVDEDRITAGTRLFGKLPGNLSYDLEVAFQMGFGRQNNRSIFAQMIGSQLMYHVGGHWKPRVYLGFDYGSGDDDPDDDFDGTFRQLFPLGHAYLGYADFVGRQNIIDGSAGVLVSPLKGMLWKADFHVLSLADPNDALYHAGGGVIRAESGGHRYVGSELDLTVKYKVGLHMALAFGYSHVFAGDVLGAAGQPGRDLDFAYTQTQFTF